MIQYLDSLDKILKYGNNRGDRTGTGTVSLFGGVDYKFDLRAGLPILTTKRMPFKMIVAELLWFLSGSSNVNDLKKIYPKCKIWDGNYESYNSRFEDVDLKGECGHVYGKAWRDFGVDHSFNGRDQIVDLIEGIKENPEGRRHIVTAWHPSLVGKYDVVLPPCHLMFHCYVEGDYLDLLMYQRSCDMFLGVPFNITSYALLLHILAKQTNLVPRYFIHKLGDAHIYKNHLTQVEKILSRDPYRLPHLVMKDQSVRKDVRDYKLDDFSLEGYEYHPAIEAPMAV